MKKIFIIVIAVVLLITGGAYASTFTAATATVGVTLIDTDFVTATAANLTDLVPTVYGDYTGTWSSGTLFTVNPHASYTGDLLIRAYLTNTGELTRYYEHLNMTLRFWSSDNTTADEQGISQVLSIDNSEASFSWANGTGTGPYKVELLGGGFRLHPWKTVSGGSIQPQVWLEITQR